MIKPHEISNPSEQPPGEVVESIQFNYRGGSKVYRYFLDGDLTTEDEEYMKRERKKAADLDKQEWPVWA